MSVSRWYFLGSTLLICLILGGILYLAGWVNGEEFSPDDFSRRRFSYNVMPFFGVTLRGIHYEESTPVFSQTLYSDGYIGTAPKIKTWNLVKDSGSDIHSADFDAKYVCRLLDLTGENNESIWQEWNNENSELANEFWPTIADLSRNYLYIEAAALMQSAIGLTADLQESFRADMNKLAADAFAQAAIRSADSGNNEKTIDLFGKSIGYLPTKQAYLGRSRAYKAMGNLSESARDREKAISIEGAE